MGRQGTLVHLAEKPVLSETLEGAELEKAFNEAIPVERAQHRVEEQPSLQNQCIPIGSTSAKF